MRHRRDNDACSISHTISVLHADRVPVLDVPAVIDALKADLADPGPAVVCCPRQAHGAGVVRYRYTQ